MSHAPVRTEVSAIAERVIAARASGGALRIVSGSTWLDAGRPCTATDRLELGALSGITSYEPGDLTLTAGAATSLAEVARVTAAEGQWLTLDPGGAPSGSIGATITTASAGPLASAFGTPRDHVLGCEFVSGAGEVVRAGGRVVKNVAGFDLVRLVTGAWGTLGALTEVTVRLRARPEEDVTLAVRVDAASADAATAGERAWRWTRESEFRPLAAELLSSSLAKRLTGSVEARLLVRLGGNARFVHAARGAVASLGDCDPVASSVWNALAAAEPAAAVVFRASALPSRIGSLCADVARVAERHDGYVHATLARGVVRCVIPVPAGDDAVQRLLADISLLGDGVTLVGERMPASLWHRFALPASSASLAPAVRRAFDPDHIMNPGILGGT